MTPLHILVAEDNELNARFLERLLTRPGHRVQVATNGHEALALAEGKGVDLLLLDVHMPGWTAFKLSRRCGSGNWPREDTYPSSP